MNLNISFLKKLGEYVMNLNISDLEFYLNSDFILQLIEINKAMDNAQTTEDWDMVTNMFGHVEGEINSMNKVTNNSILPAIHDLLVYTGERLV